MPYVPDTTVYEKPWGNYRILYVEPGFQVKRIEVNPGARLSLQKHSKRAEKWTIVKGEGKATLGEKEVPVRPGVVIAVPVGTPHRIANTGQAPLVFIEVQIGDYLGEDDIVRLHDDYNRT